MADLRITRRRALLLAAGLIAGPALPVQAAMPGPRRLDLRHAHTGERFSGPYRDAFGPIASALADLQVFLRDHHSGVSGPVSVATLDIVHEVLAAVGQERATVLSAFRTPETNKKLADRLYGVVEKSQHLHGRAIDVTLSAKLAQAAEAARGLKAGGVGWYPNSYFLHLDSGPVRNWTLGGKGLKRGFDPQAILSGAKLSRPLTVKERLELHKALAKKQFRERK